MSSTNTRTAFSKVAAPRKVVAVYSRRWDLLPYLISVMVLLTVVSMFHVWSRIRVIDLNLQTAEAGRLLKEQQQENNRLRLEVATLKNPARIEAIAKGSLGMALPTDQQVIVVR